ncbi:50S ribosomal protein L9 [Marivirga atlantica]|jgi:large subunit ribosomal protein L9|uniref:Large ribosomal subunit protein bL9 n=1 Tax=Marivirga atlantica TaxID=1548457 RepID=A0A937A9N4_9BACT|nr:50S ribosomal protein L9 [Marivirga atlantica]MBL0766180.1 50S ribosomal protein L9 [Marivirga atlantica]
MEVILTADINGLGYKNDTVNVKPGYGRNYLIPQGFAIIANDSNRKMIDENIRQAAHKAEKLQKDAEELANKIGDLTLNIKTKAGESGKIFGAVTTVQIADGLKEKGFDVDRKKIAINGDIKQVGEYTAVLDLHKEVKKEINLVVEAD